jgi:hypothetical protein
LERLEGIHDHPHQIPREHPEQVAISMETLLDLDTLSIKEATDNLHAVENRRKKKHVSPGKDASEQVLLIEEQWKARAKASSSEKSGGRGNGGGRGRGWGHSDGARSDLREKQEDGNSSDGSAERCCYCCGKLGHFPRECRSKKKVGQANLAQEEESTLMLVEGGQIQFEATLVVGGKDSSPLFALGVKAGKATAMPVTGLSTAASSLVHLVEERVFAHFNDEVKKDVKRWVLDSVASNHMTGVHAAFAELNTNIHGTVRIGDGSMVEIVGIGTMLFICKSGEH